MSSIRRWRELAFDPAIANRSVSFSDKGVVEQTDQSSTQWEWDAVRRIHDAPQAVVIEVTNWYSITLPNRLWASSDNRAAFIEQVRARGTKALPDLPESQVQANPRFLLLLIGALALGLNFAILASIPLYFVGIDLCSCAGRSFARKVAPFVFPILGLTAIVLSLVALKRLDRTRPRLASGIAVAVITLHVAILVSPFVWRLYWSITPPAT